MSREDMTLQLAIVEVTHVNDIDSGHELIMLYLSRARTLASRLGIDDEIFDEMVEISLIEEPEKVIN